ncbi:hypothetical protein [Gillisia sp. JM1]|uniref:hypothetical protein n=1 Tax=Gillisia sp. JM1 TaxID=1283286 RepID=UPI00040CFF53|nr:hypothetical protein [Gillisia sp. JM1]
MNIENLGIPFDLGLHGQVNLIRFVKNAPILFLIDENHNNLNNCIDHNILNANILIERANVQIIGVESLAGGKDWDRETDNYFKDDSNDKWYQKQVKEFKSTTPKFSDSIRLNYSNLVYGVESLGMHDKLFEESGTEGQRHWLHIERSKHFVQTLFDNYIKHGMDGNLILNCGSEHNSDIEEWVLDNSISGIYSSYVRINTIE